MGVSERDYAPDAIHLFSVLIYKCGDCVGGTVVLVDFDETVISYLQFAGSLARRRLYERAVGCIGRSDVSRQEKKESRKK